MAKHPGVQLSEAEGEVLKIVIEREWGHQGRYAEHLGVTRSTLSKALNLKPVERLFARRLQAYYRESVERYPGIIAEARDAAEARRKAMARAKRGRMLVNPEKEVAKVIRNATHFTDEQAQRIAHVVCKQPKKLLSIIV